MCNPVFLWGQRFWDSIRGFNSQKLSRTCAVAEMVKEIKRGSSLWLKSKAPELREFEWQNGYGIFSIGFSQVNTARNYIAGQETHHRKISFQDEFRGLLKRYEIEFHERYVWD